MPYVFTVDREDGRLDLRTSGSVTVEEADAIVDEAKRLCRKHSIRSVLLELGHVGTETDDLALYKIGRSWAEFARAIFDRAGIACAVADIPSSDYPTPARRPLNSRLDCSTTAAAFGIPRPDWRAGLEDILKELRETS